MSHIGSSINQQEFDFWDFVACARCHASFISEDGGPPQIPFWITECGHIVCNNHLNVDQTCIQCGSQNIQVAPLQRQMDAPMSEWFRPATQTIESLAFSTRFQIETLASLVRYYKRKCHQQHALLERAKLESQQQKLLRKKYEDLKVQTQQMRDHIRGTRSRETEPSQSVNSNGKRFMLDSRRSNHSNSSPRSSTAPLGPDRLTLQPQPFTPRLSRHTDPDTLKVFSNRTVVPEKRPGSSRFTQHFAYDAPQPGMPPTHVLLQNRNTNHRHSTTSSSPRHSSFQSHDDNQGLHRLPDVDNREKAAHHYLPPTSATNSQIQMPPPPPPYNSTRASTANRDLQAPRGTRPLPLRPSHSSESLQSNRFLPSSNSGRGSTAQPSATTRLQTQRSVPATPSASRRTANALAHDSRRSSDAEFEEFSRRHSGGQREAFVPQRK